MTKLFIFGIAVVGLLVFTPLGQPFKDHVISIINPAITQRKVVADLQQNLSTLSKTVNAPGFQKMSASEQLSKLNGLINKTATLANVVEETAAKSDITAGISTLIQKIIPSNQNNSSSNQPSSSPCTIKD
mgnify:FL=1